MAQFHDNKYLEMVQYVLDNGTWKENRTGVRTKSVFGYQMRFNLSDGTIPLLTTKKMHLRSIIHELLWYLMGTGNIQYLHDNNVSIWNEWANEQKQLGPVYGVLWRSYPPAPIFTPIPKRTISDDTTIRDWKDVIYTKEIGSTKYTNQIFQNIQGYEYQVLNYDGQINNGCVNNKQRYQKTYTVRFVNSGWIKYNVPSSSINKGNFVDQSQPSIYGVGILGDYKNKKESLESKQLRRIWENMISRCYNIKDISYETHGARGVKVCERWKVLSDFIKDVKLLPNWIAFRNNSFLDYVLDKDYYGDNKLYHPNTCAWITREHNNMYRKDAIPIVIETDEKHIYFPTESAAAKFIGTSTVAIRSRILGKVSTRYNGYNISKYNTINNLIRYPHHIDQIGQLISDIKTKPDSRRLLMSSWHPGLLPDDTIPPELNATNGRQALPPCHFQIQCYVNDGKLSMILNQRSADVGLGVPFNIVQYSLLLRMLAEVSGLLPGEFIWNGGDVHIYENHIESLQEQLTRDPYESPTFEFARQITDIDDFKFEDFIIKDYESYPTIKMDVAK